MVGIKKRLDIKLERILSDPLGSGEFIIADAKDADMGSGLTAPEKRAVAKTQKDDGKHSRIIGNRFAM